MKIVIISGTPGTGKTSVSKIITKKLNAKMISLNEMVLSNNLTLSYDHKRETAVIDTERIIEHVKRLVNACSRDNINILIIESHFSDIIPNELIDYPIVLRCHPDELIKRLNKKHYTYEKIFENVQTEILGSCMNYLIEKNLGKEIIEIDTTDLNIESVAEIITDMIKYNKNIEQFTQQRIDWLEKLFQEDKLHEYFD